MTTFNSFANRDALPGLGTELVAPKREVLIATPSSENFFPLGFVIDGSKSRDPDNPVRVDILRAGLLMGRIGGTNKYAPSVLACTNNPS